MKFAKPTMEKKVLLIAENHDSHVQLFVMDFCRNNDIVLLSFPPPYFAQTPAFGQDCVRPIQEVL